MSLRLGTRSVLVSQGLAVAALAIGSACSSTSGGSGTITPEDDGGSSGGSSSGTSSSATSSGSSSSSPSSSSGVGASSSGSGSSTSSSSSGTTSVPDGGCPEQSSVVLGVHISFPVTWPASTASATGTGTAQIWLLSNATSTGPGDLMFSGTTRSCGTTLPDIDLNAIGAAAVCAPGLTCPTKVQIQILPATFDKITRTFPTSGSQTSWNPGGTLTTTPALGLLGLSATSTFQTPGTAWPAYCASNCTPDGAFTAAEVTDDDGDGNPGITANPLNNSSYTLPPTSVTAFAVPPLADQVYIVSRNQLSITGMRMTDCNHGSGTATITLFDNHVVGCHIASPAAVCTSAQVSFLDQNRTIYGPNANDVASQSMPITGTATVQQLAAGATCADARAITN
ncbi:MAG: hypothetical protein ACLP1X_06465 [Polyangiaceae bacterium]